VGPILPGSGNQQDPPHGRTASAGAAGPAGTAKHFPAPKAKLAPGLPPLCPAPAPLSKRPPQNPPSGRILFRLPHAGAGAPTSTACTGAQGPGRGRCRNTPCVKTRRRRQQVSPTGTNSSRRFLRPAQVPRRCIAAGAAGSPPLPTCCLSLEDRGFRLLINPLPWVEWSAALPRLPSTGWERTAQAGLGSSGWMWTGLASQCLAAHLESHTCIRKARIWGGQNASGDEKHPDRFKATERYVMPTVA